ncbi:MAG: D-glycero-beta-D-manno-heptose-7-phosphate kinase [Candidatus Omnitrophica bacterium]|nr:D-glycero-beta-D-manno-heptose-7-phosphate kinase [Candidatus Omnitrophota bacterium]
MTKLLKNTSVERLLELVDSFPQTKVLVVGDFILDEFVWGNVSRISPEAPVPVVNVKRESFVPGGSLNVANNIRTLGGTVFPCGVVGRDLEGRLLVRGMRRLGIDLGGVIMDGTRPTTLKTRVIAHSQQVVRFDREKVEPISRVDAQKILRFVRKKIKEVDAIVIEDYGKGVVEPFLLLPLLRLVKQSKKPVFVDPKEKHFSFYKGVTAITPNRLEAYNMYGESSNGRQPDLEKVGKGLLNRLKSKAILVTLGEEGMALFEKDYPTVKIPTTAREVFDVSGAGDTVIAIFALGVAAGATLKEAAVLANLAAGVVVGKLGTATVEPSELKQAIQSEAVSVHA